MIKYFREGKLPALHHPTSIGDILFDLLIEKDKKVPLHKFWTVSSLYILCVCVGGGGGEVHGYFGLLYFVSFD